MFVKICGIKWVEDARMALGAGADAIGFLLGQKYPSGDFIEISKANEILCRLPDRTKAVAVTHLNSEDSIRKILNETGINCLQLHSETDDSIIRSLRNWNTQLKIIRAIHVVDIESVELACRSATQADVILLDSRDDSSGRIGGTGKTHDWEISRAIVASLDIPVVLAGGLHPGNIQEAIRMVRPFGVDANTGLQYPNTFKDAQKCRQFIEAAKLYKLK
ncbi:MAG: phosphoribosylanthranilate isomerase [Bacteroidota bacterium]|nr:phosphoribosylanthranilate isomerase [Bacteroidota bacterium]